jgi:sucrose porin
MTMFKSKLALAVALGLGNEQPAVGGGWWYRLVWRRWRRGCRRPRRATAAEARADEAQSKANEARETAVVAKAQSEKVDKQTAGAQGFEFHGYARSGLLVNGNGNGGRRRPTSPRPARWAAPWSPWQRG